MDEHFREQIIRQVDTGRFLLAERTKRNLTQPIVAKQLGVSPSYLSEIEKGVKVPSDLLIQELGKYYEIDEDELFQKYGKLPLLAKEEIKNSEDVQKALADIARLRKKKALSDDQCQKLYEEWVQVYQDFIKRINQSEG
ncbi:MAG: helix-turn-helix transcriptional regulator [Peptococcaceae bacterium]|nr:helix-turn-helix transcriptional regulator [Peptococcaceae bacterium]